MLVNVESITLKKGSVLGISIQYPKCKLLSLTVQDVGVISCSIMEPANLDAAHIERKGIFAKIEGEPIVKGEKNPYEFVDLLKGKITGLTVGAEEIGIKKGMTGEEAINKMFDFKNKK